MGGNGHKDASHSLPLNVKKGTDHTQLYYEDGGLTTEELENNCLLKQSGVTRFGVTDGTLVYSHALYFHTT